ncbi:acetylglutamate kinase [Alphaproteobacteria bacterium]|jgi:acetylglutamate kinase|nr:acetylglutamate kinase [Alphaproteobacteria bacterium]|tara:strand:- start:55 stop:969 length:915 start_codon:yes stop_codon:yes gene_type:complete
MNVNDVIKNISIILGTSVNDIEKYIEIFQNKVVVIKYGGHAMGDKKLAHTFAEDVTLLQKLGIKPVVIHGGGPQIGSMLDKLNIESSFIDGLRITNEETVEIVEMVLSGSINKDIVNKIHAAGGLAVGLSGKDAKIILADKLTDRFKDPNSNIEKFLDIGFVGKPIKINPSIINIISDNLMIPIIAPVGFGTNNETYNINADTAAGAIASSLKAERILLLTDVEGVLDSDKKLISNISVTKAESMINDKIITGGMIPKIKTCLETVASGVKAAVIIDGRSPHAILREIFTTGGSGTMIDNNFGK